MSAIFSEIPTVLEVSLSGHFSERLKKLEDRLRYFMKYNEVSKIKAVVYFSDDTPVYFYKSHKWTRKITLTVFKNEDVSTHFSYCRSNTVSKTVKSMGLNQLILDRVERVVIKQEELIEDSFSKNLKKVIKQRYEGCWTDLSENMDFMKVQEIETHDISQTVPSDVMNEISNAFEFKEDYLHSYQTETSEHSIAMGYDSDGVYRATLTEDSDFFDVTNQYYLLNPSLALLVETY